MRNSIIAIITIWLVSSIAVESRGQDRVFARVPIDEIQNRRLDASESRLDRIEKSIADLTGVVQQLAERKPGTSVVSPAPAVTHVGYQAAPTVKQSLTVQPAPKPSTHLAIAAWQAYPDGVYRVRHADVQPRNQVWNHLISHGFSREEVSGLSQFEALAIHDLAHGGKVHPGQRVAPAVQQVSYQPPQIAVAPVQTVAQYNVGCANGQCARPSYAQSRLRQQGVLFWRMR